jgi:hypothetical protein
VRPKLLFSGESYCISACCVRILRVTKPWARGLSLLSVYLSVWLVTVTCCAQISHPTLSRSGFSIEIRQSVVAKGDVCMQKKKEEESAREKELSELFKVAISQPKVPLGMLIGFPLVLIFGSCANSLTPSFSFVQGGFCARF